VTPSLASAKLLLNESAKKILKKVDNSSRRDVELALARFAENPLDSRLRFEKYKNMDNLYTIRATYNLRIYMADDGGMQMQLVHIGNHDYIKRLK
jgi:hypothetical protein